MYLHTASDHCSRCTYFTIPRKADYGLQGEHKKSCWTSCAMTRRIISGRPLWTAYLWMVPKKASANKWSCYRILAFSLPFVGRNERSVSLLGVRLWLGGSVPLIYCRALLCVVLQLSGGSCLCHRMWRCYPKKKKEKNTVDSPET